MEDAEANCRRVLEKLSLFLDNELGESDCADIMRHLDLCSHCGDVARFETELKAVIRMRCCEEPIPEGMEERLRAELRGLL